jgi:hypothetical protein
MFGEGFEVILNGKSPQFLLNSADRLKNGGELDPDFIRTAFTVLMKVVPILLEDLLYVAEHVEGIFYDVARGLTIGLVGK